MQLVITVSRIRKCPAAMNYGLFQTDFLHLDLVSLKLYWDVNVIRISKWKGLS